MRRNFSGSAGSSSDLLYSRRVPERKRPIDGVNESDSSGSTTSASSSFYHDDNSELSQARASEFQRLKTDHNRVDRQTQKSARFDKVMKRVTSVLDAPMFHELKEEKKEEAKRDNERSSKLQLLLVNLRVLWATSHYILLSTWCRGWFEIRDVTDAEIID
jgi:hypothetical protein